MCRILLLVMMYILYIQTHTHTPRVYTKIINNRRKLSGRSGVGSVYTAAVLLLLSRVYYNRDQVKVDERADYIFFSRLPPLEYDDDEDIIVIL